MYIVALEGIDASGKETQAKLLSDSLKSKGYKVYSDSFPRYESPIGNLIKQWLFDEIELSEEAFHMLLEADRQDFQDKLDDLDHEGYDFVILDRYTMSNLVFGSAKGYDMDWLKDLQGSIQQPDFTFIIDISPETSIKRRQSGRDKHEQDLDLLYKARTQYKHVGYQLADEGVKVFLVDGEAEQVEIHKQVLLALFDHLVSELPD